VLDLVPPSLALLPHSQGPYAALLVIGFVVGIVGRLLSQRWLIATGILLIFLAALLLPLAGGLPGSDKPPAGREEAPLEPGE
jgi:hypothetical protein